MKESIGKKSSDVPTHLASYSSTWCRGAWDWIWWWTWIFCEHMGLGRRTISICDRDMINFQKKKKKKIHSLETHSWLSQQFYPCRTTWLPFLVEKSCIVIYERHRVVVESLSLDWKEFVGSGMEKSMVCIIIYKTYSIMGRTFLISCSADWASIFLSYIRYAATIVVLRPEQERWAWDFPTFHKRIERLWRTDSSQTMY